MTEINQQLSIFRTAHTELEVLTEGYFPWTDGTKTEVIKVTRQDLEEIMLATTADIAEGNFPQIDEDHKTIRVDADGNRINTTAGYGEIVSVKIGASSQNPDTMSLWATPRWNLEGIQAVESGKYTRLSPVIGTAETTEADAESVAANLINPYKWLAPRIRNGKVPFVKPVVLFGIGLTNDPNMKQLQRISHSRTAAGEPNQETKLTKQMKQLLALLGLSESASEAEAITVLSDLKANAKATAEQLGHLMDQAADAFCENHQIAPDHRATWVEAYKANPKSAAALIAGIQANAAKVEAKAPGENPFLRKAQPHAAKPALNLNQPAGTVATPEEARTPEEHKAVYKQLNGARSPEGRAYYKKHGAAIVTA